MTGLEKITERILGDAKSDADKIIGKAKEDSAEIISGYDQRAKTEAEKIIAAAREQAGIKRKNAVNFARLEMRMHLLSVKNELIDEAFRLAANSLSLDKKENIDLLCGIAAKAVQGDQEVVLHPSVKKAQGDYITEKINAFIKDMGKNAHVKLSEETRELNGLVLKSGNIETNCTVDSIIAARRDALIPLVNACLFD